MKIKSIEMTGFKSFPDKTRLVIENGITGVVGPNGSGKSNISDAIRWVFGEMSAKSIRSAKLEDVIFSGSDNRRRMDYAEVSLILDNTQGIGRLDSDRDEVSITRRYFRGGDSEYRINGEKKRLRDIAELFMNTGVGKTGYSNIGQGKIAEIISQRSDDRRSVFEEAAGISKYRAQKNEAESSLRRTEDNLLRVGDILSELGDRVVTLEKEAAAARKYLDLYEQKKAVDVSLWLYETESMRAVSDETERLFTSAKMSLDSLDEQMRDSEAKEAELFEKMNQNRADTESVSARLDEMKQRGNRLENSNSLLENNILHYESQISQIKQDNAVRRAALSDGVSRGELLSLQNESQKKRLEEIETEISSAEAELEKLEEACLKADEEILARDDERHEAEEKVNELRLKLSAADGSHEAGAGRRSDLEKQEEALVQSIAALTDSRARHEKSAAGYSEAAAAALEKLNAVRARADEISGETDRVRERLSSESVAVDTKKQRAESLRRMDELLEGYSYAVRNVMLGADNGSIIGICGPVSRLIRVKKQYSIAIETSLGANIQNIVTEDEDAAKAAIAYLKRTNGGRTTFYPLTSVQPRTSAVSADSLRKRTGFVSMAGELCDCDDRYRKIVDYLLGGTAVFDNLENASATARTFGYRLRIVTLDGQLINAGGSYTGGSVKTDSGILTRQAEINALNDEVTELEIKLNATRAHLESLAKDSEECAMQISDIENRLSLTNSLCANEQTACEVAKARLESEQEALDSVKRELGGIGEADSRFDMMRSDLCMNIKRAEDALIEKEKLTSEARRASAAADDARDDAQAALNALLVERAGAEKSLEAGTENEKLNSGSVDALRSQIENAENSIIQLEEKLVNARGLIKEQVGEHSDISEDIKRLEEDRKRLAEQNLRFEKRQTELRDELNGLHQKRDVIYSRYADLDAKRSTISSEYERTSARMWEDYELTFTKAKELNYPPVTVETRDETAKKQTELRNRLRAVGHVNVSAIEEYAHEKERYEFNKNQFDDLTRAKESLNGIIERLEREMKKKFITAFEAINKNFGVTFRELFGGGTAEISLSDPENILESGIEINVAPPGKIIKNLIALSGGEQAFVAIALIFAILNVNPTPFCIFDEIESALDEVNVIRLAEYMKRYSEKTQFIVITHRRGTMEAADMLYGITMPDRGVSKVLSMNVGEIESKMGEQYT